jgi:hypothetical protein
MDEIERMFWEDRFKTIARHQEEQTDLLRKINNTLLFLGAVVLLSLIAGVCQALGLHL